MQEYRLLINTPIDAAEVSIHKWEALRTFSMADCGFCILHREDEHLDCEGCEVFTTCRHMGSISDILGVLDSKLQDFLEEEEKEAQLSKEKK